MCIVFCIEKTDFYVGSFFLNGEISEEKNELDDNDEMIFLCEKKTINVDITKYIHTFM